MLFRSITITLNLTTGPVGIGSAIPVRATINNFTAASLPAGRLLVYPNSYFSQGAVAVPSIPSMGSTSVNVTLVPNGGVTVFDLDLVVKFEYQGSKKHTQPIRFPVYIVSGNIVQPPQADESYNVLLYGIAGATKSSFINSLLTMLTEGDELVVKAVSGGSGDHVTRALTRFAIPKIRMNFWDTWGLTPETYQNDELVSILDGVFPSNWSMHDDLETNSEFIQMGESTRRLRKIHAVLFFVPHGSLDNVQIQKIIKDNYQFFQEKQMNPIVILTKADEVSNAIRKDPFHGESDPDIAALKTKAQRLLNITPNSIFFGINYFKEQTKVTEIDRANLMILKKIASIARQNYQSQNNIVNEPVVHQPKPKPKTREPAKPTYDW